jgi:hypothetical protein
MIEQEHHREALRSLALLYLDCGTADEYNLHFSHRKFSEKATRSSVDHRYEEFKDSHANTSYRYAFSLPELSHAIAG